MTLEFHAEVSLLTFQVVSSQMRCLCYQAPKPDLYLEKSALAQSEDTGNGSAAYFFYIFKHIFETKTSHLSSITFTNTLGKYLSANYKSRLAEMGEPARP